MSDQIQPWPLVKRGSQGHPVPALQYLLRDRGHHVTVDGIFGPKTEAAVEQFQTADQLHVDGIVGPQTWGALIIVLARGSTGDAVRGLQEEFEPEFSDIFSAIDPMIQLHSELRAAGVPTFILSNTNVHFFCEILSFTNEKDCKKQQNNN